MMTAVLKAGRGIRWYLKQVTGEAKWDEYLERCRREGAEPMSRRHFERHRAEHQETNPRARCC
ncbi:MAG: YbdD/YjiX family protein [Dermatophilaceae bacterium]|nr:YbdD/YjiX family protein [Dermatophilaceae bacterium]